MSRYTSREYVLKWASLAASEVTDKPMVQVRRGNRNDLKAARNAARDVIESRGERCWKANGTLTTGTWKAAVQAARVAAAANPPVPRKKRLPPEMREALERLMWRRREQQAEEER